MADLIKRSCLVIPVLVLALTAASLWTAGQGQMSAHTYFTLKYLLGYPDVRNYDGSFNEWSNLRDLPVNTGMTP